MTGANGSQADPGATPLSGVRVLNLGGIWASRVAAMLLADQGAEVIELVRPDRAATPIDALLGRGQTMVSLNLKSKQGQQVALDLASNAHIVLDNLGPARAESFGLDYERVCEVNPSVVYISMPGFASGSPQSAVPAWEGSIAASVGVYTDLHSAGLVLGDAPVFTAVPMASSYGGVHAAVAAMAAFFQRVLTGHGQKIEVPLADALMSSMSLLAMRVEAQPRRFDLPPIDRVMREIALPLLREFAPQFDPKQRDALRRYIGSFSRAQFAHHTCGDGRVIFLNALDHSHQSYACLKAMGLLDDLLAEGMVIGNPYTAGGAGNEICNAAGLSDHWNQRLKTVMSERFRTKSAAEWESILREAGVPVAMCRTSAEWLDLPEARTGGVVTLLDDPVFGATTQAGRFVSIEGKAACSPTPQPQRLADGDITWQSRTLPLSPQSQDSSDVKPLAGIRVLDLSNIIAGPVAARTLADLGADVIRIDPPTPLAGPRLTMWFGIDVNQGKRAMIVDLKSESGREVLRGLIRDTDVLIHNSLDASAERLGIAPHQLKAWRPDLITCQVSAWGGPTGGPLKDYPAFDPVLQAATGITTRYGSAENPVLHGIASCVDYISGFLAALGVLQALTMRALGRKASHVRTSLAMGAQLVQFPYMVKTASGASGLEETGGQGARGFGSHYSLYPSLDGWVFLAFRSADAGRVARLLGAQGTGPDEIRAAIATMRLADLQCQLREVPSLSIVNVTRLDDLRAAIVIEANGKTAFDTAGQSIVMVRAPHPSGKPVTLPLATWYRRHPNVAHRLEPAPLPGTHTRSVLEEYGFPAEQIDTLFSRDVVRSAWQVLPHYLPH